MGSQNPSNRWKIAAALLLLAANGGYAATRYVWTGSPNPGGGYLSWNTAAHDIQSAIDSSADGDLILLTNETHVLSQTITLDKGVTVRGVSPDVSSIDGNDSVRCVYMYHPDAVLDSVHITRGYCTQPGGGVYINQSGTVQNCIVGSCVSTVAGGGVYMYGGGLIYRTSVQYNRSEADYGGGVACYGGGTVVESGIVRNRSTGLSVGGGVACLGTSAYISKCNLWMNESDTYGGGGVILNGGFISNCDIYGNNATNHGGGIYMQENGTLLDSLVHNNSAGTNSGSGDGGGVYITGSGSLYVDRTMIYNNYCRGNGGGISVLASGFIMNSLIRGNRAEQYGGGIDAGVSAVVDCCTVAANYSGLGGAVCS